MMILWVLVIALIVWFGWTWLQRTSRGGSPLGGPAETAEEILRARYARGEIDEATYKKMLDELRAR